MTELQINTTQNVNISFTAATVGERILAYFIDAIVMFAYLYGIIYVIELMGFNGVNDMWSKKAIVSLLFLPVMLYTFISEISMNGQTLGKKVLKIKVVKIDGYQPSILDFFMRWVFRLVDIYAIFFITGLVAMISVSTSKKNQRLGGMSSGTGVISLKNLYTIKSTILEELDSSYKAMYPSVINLSDNDMRIIKDLYYKALKEQDSKTLNKLRIKIETITKTSREKKTNKEYLRIIMKDYTHFTQNM